MTDRQTWLEERRKGIGGSDVAAILGLSQWKTPLDVYLDKIGTAPLESEETEAMYWGNVLEDVVAREFATRTGRRVIRQNKMFRHPLHPELLANIDRLVCDPPELLEVKTTNSFNLSDWGDEGTDHIPLPYLCQCQHYMSVTTRPVCHLAVLIGGSKFRTYVVQHNPELALLLTERCLAFWRDNVMANVPPPPRTLADVEALYHAGGQVVAEVDIEAAARQLADLKSALKPLEAGISNNEMLLKQALGDAAELITPEGEILATWKATPTKRLDTTELKKQKPEIWQEFARETTSRRFLLKVKAEQETGDTDNE